MLIIASKQKESLALSRRSQLKEQFDKKLEMEKEKLETNMLKQVRDFEEAEKLRKDQELVKQQNLELKQEKEKRQLQIRGEIDEIKLGLEKRLENYRQVLREKFENEKEVIRHCPVLIS